MRFEFLGSLLTFSICLVGANFHRRWILYLSVCALFILEVHEGYFYCLFVAGIWMADVGPKRLNAIPSLIILALSVWIGGFRHKSLSHLPLENLTFVANGVPINAYFICSSIAGALIVAVVLWWDVAGRLAGHFNELGRRSFSLYLIHFPVLGTVGIWIYRTVGARIPDNTIPALCASTAVIAVSYVLSGLFAAWIDEPAMRMSHIISNALFSSKESMTPAKSSGNDDQTGTSKA
jgi:peptidoglycan/LPS O-acetylase OafA/YrhL